MWHMFFGFTGVADPLVFAHTPDIFAYGKQELYQGRAAIANEQCCSGSQWLLLQRCDVIPWQWQRPCGLASGGPGGS